MEDSPPWSWYSLVSFSAQMFIVIDNMLFLEISSADDCIAAVITNVWSILSFCAKEIGLLEPVAKVG